MALEDLTGASKYLAALNPANPDPLDAKSQGDDHIRGIKNVLLNTFGAIAAPVSLTNLARTNVAETISATWSFTAKPTFVSAQNSSAFPSYDFINTTPVTGKSYRVVAETAGDFVVYDLTAGRYLLVCKADGSVQVTNKAIALQRAGWQPNVIVVSASRNFAPSDSGQVLLNSGNNTLTFSVGGLTFPDVLKIINLSAGTLTIASSGTSIFWMKGGSQSVGNRTIAPSSSISLVCSSATELIIDGNGIT